MLVLLLSLALCSPPDRAVVAEVFYDAIGDDTGQEFVELFNPTAHAVALAGLRLEAGDGAGPGRWTLRWTGQPGDSIRAGARFVIGGALVVPSPDAVVTLDLQNGPDAARLVWLDGGTETVGWGALAYPEYFCGAPAPDAASGSALARVPDGADLGSNALAFRAQPPSPGSPNQPGLEVALRAGSLTVDPEQPAVFGQAQLSATIVNQGAVALEAGRVTLTWMLGDTAASRVLESALAPGDSARASATLHSLPAGKALAIARAELAGDERPANNSDSAWVRVGKGPLEITEIQYHPAHGEGEWVEVRCRETTPCDLASFRISDRGAALGVPDPDAPALAPESLAVFAEDRVALLAFSGGLDPERVVAVKPWASLNNSNDTSGVADAVVIRERDGTRSDRVDYSATGVPAGVPLERDGDRWGPSSDPVGTPARPPHVLPPLSSRFEITPRRIRPGADGSRLAWALPWPRAWVSVEAYDLEGRRVARLLTEEGARGRAERKVRLDGMPAGLYVVVLRAKSEEGSASVTVSRAMRIEGEAP
jgi:hypothetical protein